MTRQAKRAVRQVLKEAAETPNFFDLSDGERLVRMIAMAFKRGRHVSRRSSKKDRHQRIEDVPACCRTRHRALSRRRQDRVL